MRSARSLLAVTPILISILALLTIQLAQPPNSLRPRIFVIGLSKTGTTSIGDALQQLGYRRLGWRDVRSRHMVHTWANGDMQALVDLTRHYDALEDLPWPFVYREMAELYPDAKFILSLRKDEETWMRSMQRHVGRGRWTPHAYFYGADTFEGNEAVFRSSYANHTRNVREFFQDQPHRLIELNIDDGDINWSVLCSVTEQCPSDDLPTLGFPKSNTAAHWEMGRIVNAISWCWGWTVTRLEELSAFYYYESRWTYIRPLMSMIWTLFDVVEQAFSELYFKVSLYRQAQAAGERTVTRPVF